MATIEKKALDTRKLVLLALLTAIVVALQVLANYVTFGPVAITLALAPTVIGAALIGTLAGGWLGLVFGAVVLTAPSTAGFMEYNALATVVICLLKGACAGLAAGAVYRLLSKKNRFVAVLFAGIVAPIVNTGIFAIGSLTVFKPFFSALSDTVVAFVFLTVIGVNFLIELGVNVVLSSVITRLIGIGSKNRNA